MPLAFGDAPLSRPCTSDDTPPVKSISARSACASAVGSSEAVTPPTVTLGWPPAPSETKTVLMTPSKLTSCAFSASTTPAALRVKIDNPRPGEPVEASTLMTSAVLSPMSILPTMCEPSFRFSVSAAFVSLIAVPAAPVTLLIEPELVITVPLVLSVTWMATLPEMLPALTIVAWPASTPKAWLEMLPVLALVTFAVVAALMPATPPKMLPALSAVTDPSELIPEFTPEMLPVLALVTWAMTLEEMPKLFAPVDWIRLALATMAESPPKMAAPPGPDDRNLPVEVLVMVTPVPLPFTPVSQGAFCGACCDTLG